MPIRTFACMNEDCPEMGKAIDALKGLHETDSDPCPSCGKEMSPVMPCSVGIAFKGTGFYCTDYR